MKDNHQYYIEQCIAFGRIALAAGNPPVGAIVVLKGEIIGNSIESGKSTGDITNHAEILAIRDAVNNGFVDRLHMAVMYTTHEPCIMCSYVIRHHRISRIVYGISVPYIGGATSKFNILSTKDVPKWGGTPEIISGICSEECNKLTEEFVKSIKS